MKKSGIFLVPALLCACYLSAQLAFLGVDKFYYLLAGGGKFATFPDWHRQLGIGVSYVALQLLFLLWFFDPRQQPAVTRFWQVLGSTAVFLLLALIAYPLGNDIYIYLHSGLMNLSDVNPFLTRAGAFTTELSPYVDWGQTSTYGPLSQLLFALGAAILPVHPLLAVYAFKAICLVLHVLNGLLVWRLLQPLPERGKVTIAYLLHPLLLFEQVGSAHIDVIVSNSLILLASCVFLQRYALGFLAMWAGFLSKTLPLIWMPLVGVFLVRRRQWTQLCLSIVLSAGLIALLWLTVLPNLAAWSSLLNPGVEGQYKSSIHELVKFGLDWWRLTHPKTLTLTQQNFLLLKVSQYTKLGFAIVYAVFALKILRQREYTEFTLLEDLGWVTLILLLFATPWVMPWYASVMVTFAAVLPKARLLGLTSLMFALASSAQYLLQGLDGISCLVAIGLPIVTVLIGVDVLHGRAIAPVENLVPADSKEG